MLTDQQLTETAIRIVLRELNDLGTFDRGDDIERKLCLDHCGGAHAVYDCQRDKDWSRESQTVHGEIKDAVNVLRIHLRDYAAARQIPLNVGEALV